MLGQLDEQTLSHTEKPKRTRVDEIVRSSVNSPTLCRQHRSRDKELGQGMTEYIIIVALVAVAAIAVYQSFGRVIRAQTAAIANELAGEKSNTALRAARSAAKDAGKQIKDKSLKSYGANSR